MATRYDALMQHAYHASALTAALDEALAAADAQGDWYARQWALRDYYDGYTASQEHYEIEGV